VNNNYLPRIRIKDIAGLAGVSTGTVDRVLHNRGEVSKETREKILGIIREMDYQPDILASILATKKAIRIAVLLPEDEQATPFWKYPMAGIEEGLREIMHFGISLERYFFDYSDSASFLEQSAAMLENKPHGVILAPVFTRESGSLLDKCNKQSIPVVLINSNICLRHCIAFVGQDSLQSGMVAARLMHFGLKEDAGILIVNFIREDGNKEHILKREEGFRKYYSGQLESGGPDLKFINISDTDDLQIDKALQAALFSPPGKIRGIFVTNSRVFQVARFLEKERIRNTILIGYDLLEENKDYLRKGTIDFLISQKPREQGLKSIMTLYHHLVLKKTVERNQYLPIDIITKENLEHYKFT
jgi:LacI family transcriptional regulator